MQERLRAVVLGSIVGNALVAALKILGSVLSGSLALLADGSDSVLNVASASVTYWVLKESSKEPDEEHPYGHVRAEVYGSVVILLLMGVTFSFVAFEALDRVSHGVPERVSSIGLVFAAASMALNLAVSSLLRSLGRGSIAAATEARHVSLDVAEGVVTLAGVALGSLLSALYDLIAAAAIMAIVTYFIVVTLRELRSLVMDTSPPRAVMEQIEEVLRSTSGVLGFHNLRARQLQGRIFADVHLEMDPKLTLEEVHRTCDSIENALRAKLGNVDIVIHVEPPPSTEKNSGGKGE